MVFDWSLTGFIQGTINSTHTGITGTPTNSGTYTLDAVGNMTTYGSGSRTVNAQNELTSGPTYTPVYDNNGNLTSGLYITTSGGHTNGTFTYDAWNHITLGTTNSTYAQYDALGRRVFQGVFSTAYSAAGQALEDFGGGVHNTYVWGPGYVNDLVTLDQVVSGQPVRFYLDHDANYNVITMTNSGGGVLAVVAYDPYGQATFIMNTTWTSFYNFLYQGGRYDQDSQTYLFDNRNYAPVIGAWLEQDPAGYVDGANLYQFVGSSPLRWVDPTGLNKDRHSDSSQGSWEWKLHIWGEPGTDGSTTRFGTAAYIKFTTPAGCKCQIGLIQAVRFSGPAGNSRNDYISNDGLRARTTKAGFAIDQSAAKGDSPYYGEYGFKENRIYDHTTRSPNAIQMHDGPGPLLTTNGVNSLYFITAAVVQSGKDEGKILGWIKWGFFLDSNNEGQIHGVIAHEGPDVPPEWLNAARGWNQQIHDDPGLLTGSNPAMGAVPIPGLP